MQVVINVNEGEDFSTTEKTSDDSIFLYQIFALKWEGVEKEEREEPKEETAA